MSKCGLVALILPSDILGLHSPASTTTTAYTISTTTTFTLQATTPSAARRHGLCLIYTCALASALAGGGFIARPSVAR